MTSWSASRPSSDPAAAHTQTTSAPAARRPRRAERVGRGAAGGEDDHGVGRVDADGGEVGGARAGIVLDRLLRHGEGRRPAGRDGDDLARWDAERRPAFGRVGEGHAPRRARADVDQPPSGGEPADDLVDRRGEGLGRGAYGRCYARVLVVHQLDELGRRTQVEVELLAEVAFGDRLVPGHACECSTGQTGSQASGIDHLPGGGYDGAVEQRCA